MAQGILRRLTNPPTRPEALERARPSSPLHTGTRGRMPAQRGAGGGVSSAPQGGARADDEAGRRGTGCAPRAQPHRGAHFDPRLPPVRPGLHRL